MKSWILFIVVAVLAGCGVRGVPLPPERPAPIGRGEPTFQKAAESLEIELDKSKKDQRPVERDGP